MTDSTRDMLYGHLIGTRENLTELWERIDGPAVEECARCGGTGELHGEECPECEGLGEHEFTDYEGSDPMDYLNELPLEVVWERGELFAVVLGTGGPHIEIRGGTRHDGMSYTLHGYWGGEHVTVSGQAITRTGEYFRDLVDQES